MATRNILLYGRSNSGKTAQLGQLAEHTFKQFKKRTRLYSADRGGAATIQPYIELGLVDYIAMESTDPWIFLNRAVRGYVRDGKGKWMPGKNEEIGCFAFEGLRSFAEALFASMEAKVGAGINIGGGSNVNFAVQGDGESLKISGGNQAMFGVAQQRMTTEVWESQKLAAEFLIWTSSVSKEDDLVAAGKVLGPDVIGKALTTEVPRWFHNTFRIDVLPAQAGKPEKHLLYMGTHCDVNAGNAAGLGNTRLPLDAPALAVTVVDPANIVRALEMLEGGRAQATDTIKKRLGLK